MASILIAAVLPLASAQAQREREAELIFRGLQYAEGIRIFRRRFGRFPNSLKELLEVKPRSVRKLWKDPMTKDGEWGIISIGGDPRDAGRRGGLGAEHAGRPRRPDRRPTPGPFGRRGGRRLPGDGGAPAGPVMGVYSKSTRRATASGRGGRRTASGASPRRAWRPGRGGRVRRRPGPGVGGGRPGGPGRSPAAATKN